MENSQVILARRPGTNSVTTVDCFLCQPCPTPDAGEIPSGHLIVRTTYLSVDPALRCRLNEDTGVHYMQSIKEGECVTWGGCGTVMHTNCDMFAVGDIVMSAFSWPWQKVALMRGEDLKKIPAIPPGFDESITMSCLGLIGLTVALAFDKMDGNEAANRNTCVITAAAGACGTLAGQIAKSRGYSNIIGVCGRDDKCNVIKSKFGYTSAINYKTVEDMAAEIGRLAPNGVDLYFDNVGGATSEAVIRNMNRNSHVILCGQITAYNTDAPYPPPIGQEIEDILKRNNITRERYLVLNYESDFPSTLAHLHGELCVGGLRVECTVAEGLHSAGAAFVSMMEGGNIGKQIVKL